jgi:hypothetical protein
MIILGEMSAGELHHATFVKQVSEKYGRGLLDEYKPQTRSSYVYVRLGVEVTCDCEIPIPVNCIMCFCVHRYHDPTKAHKKSCKSCIYPRYLDPTQTRTSRLFDLINSFECLESNSCNIVHMTYDI